MKKALLSFCFLFVFCFSGFGQVDTAAVVQEVDSLIQVSRALTGTGDFSQALEVNAAAEKIAMEGLNSESVAYSSACLNHGRVLHIKGDYPLAKKWYLKAQDIREKVLGKEHPDYAQCLNTLGALNWYMGNYEKAESLYLEAKDIREKALGKEHPDYANSLVNLGVLYWKTGNFEKALPFYLESKAIIEKTLGKEHYDYTHCLNNLANLYWAMGNFEKALPLHLEAKDIREKTLGRGHPAYTETLNNLSGLYADLGDYEKAELLDIETIAVREKTLGKEHPNYANSLNNLAAVYMFMGNYEKAELLLLESKVIHEKALRSNHPDYAKCLDNLAAIYSAVSNYEKAEQFNAEAITIWEKALGKEHPDHATSLNNLGVLYHTMHNYEKAELLLLETKAIREKALGKEHAVYATSLTDLANLYLDMGDFERAEQLYLQSKGIWEKALGREHQEYTESLDHLAMLYWTTGDFNAAKYLLLENRAVEKSLLLKATRHLSEREIYFYISKFAEGTNKIFSSPQKKPEISEACYDNTLFHKGFLLTTASQISNLAQTDSLSTEKYNLLKSYHRRLASEYTLPITERDSTLIAELETKANETEKSLVRTVTGFGEALRQVSWQEVQAALLPGEAAIEFIRFNYYKPQPTDSILYAALLLKPGIESPAFINLFEEKQLEALLAPLAVQGSDGWNELYEGKAGESLYQLLWQPLEAHLKGVKTVYFSPAGLLHRLNLNAILIAKSATLSDRFELAAMGSTRQLVVASGQQTVGTAETAVIFGGIQYEMDSAAILPAEPEGLANRHRGPSFSQTDSALRGGTWKYLKYSDKEADNIQSLLQTAGFQAEVRKGYAATEEAFKLLGKGQPSPRILHVSTHGFFFPDPASPSEGPGGAFRASGHPMIRSGLILAGANHAWQTGQPLGNREDGILTAYEISQMDLRNTELVVLSACETGLGDIRGNEGVYGLQRAFRIAGAKYLIMSLWQVPDFQTQELMTVLYQKWLEEKMTVRQALKAAQEEMRQKRYEPFYWAGFVLVE